MKKHLKITMLFLFLSVLAFSQSEKKFIGTWKGNMSGLPVEIKVFSEYNQINGSISFSGKPENLNYLGYKNTIPGIYFWRPSDKACICLYFEGDQLIMTYFEKDSVRKVFLK